MMNQTTPKPATGLIYQPRGQAGEYAALATNPYRGCGHGCAYCYVPAVLRMDRREFDAGATLRPGYLQGLIKQAPKFRHGPQVWARASDRFVTEFCRADSGYRFF